MPIFQPPALSIFDPGTVGEGNIPGKDIFQHDVEFTGAATFDGPVSVGSINVTNLEVFDLQVDHNFHLVAGIGNMQVDRSAIFNAAVTFNADIGVTTINGSAYPPTPGGIVSPIHLSANDFQPNPADANPPVGSVGKMTRGAASTRVWSGIDLGTGNTATTITAYVNTATVGGIVLSLFDSTNTSVAPTLIGSAVNSTNAGNQTLVFSTSIPIVAGHSYVIEILLSAAGAALFGCDIAFT